MLQAETKLRILREIVEEETAAILASPPDWPGLFPIDGVDLEVCVARVVFRGVTDRAVIRDYMLMAAILGIDFETRPEFGWLVARLDDRTVTSPDERVRLAHAEWVRRLKLAEENARREADFLRRCEGAT